ncbi:MAG: FAD-dependent oxidoreductase [Clostridiales Family XIII bacterium]|jgi:2,4-dienoyl-CoA reductase-like NADH-dependent reductase (Old Yellow Enzyme family)/thioredoxin reductase|nr:FAD-dependent oxidoreductase [Clostridiales Family XIII bacterium]
MTFENKYKKLFEPITLAGTHFGNRIFASPTGYQDMDLDGKLAPTAAYYYARKAIGGAASVTVGECMVDSELGMGSPYHGRLDRDYCHHPYALITAAVTRSGAVPTAELSHSGMYANRWMDPPGIAYGPVDCDDNGRPVRAMTEKIIEHTIRKYADAAAFAKRCGFGMVMVHAGHGWLLHQFMHPVLNTRADRWGGSAIENRARLTVAVLDAIRAKVGRNFPIEVRISGSECYEGGYDIDEGIAFAKQLDGHADLIHVSAGSHEVEEVFTVTHPSMFLPDGVNVRFAAEVKKQINTPVATVGALADPEQMEEIIASGKADVLEIARGLLADPDIPKKARAGKSGEIRTCMRCLACFSELMHTGQFFCAINPEIGREQEIKLEMRPAARKKVLIAGGGVAGMQAALTCAERGHEVILCEKESRLGGTLLCEEKVGFKQKLEKYLRYQERTVREAGVDVRTDTAVTETYARDIEPDAIISAMGARPVVPKIPGIDGENVLPAEDAYRDPDKTGGAVVILGAGLVGMELAIYLSTLGKKASIVEMADRVNDGGNFQHMKALNVEIARYGIGISLNTKAVRITGEGAICESADGAFDGEKLFAADTVVYAVGQAPLSAEADSLRYCAPEFYEIGDCVRPRNIMNATAAAFETARIVGI